MYIFFFSLNFRWNLKLAIMRSTTHFDVLIFIYITKWNSYLLIKKITSSSSPLWKILYGFLFLFFVQKNSTVYFHWFKSLKNKIWLISNLYNTKKNWEIKKLYPKIQKPQRNRSFIILPWNSIFAADCRPSLSQFSHVRNF